ncbi:hypothetical protein HRbin16_02819 [bacterium HR16]|nr:hypothetical protein HRbin16_02819 [bacterium HR16]
MGIENRNLRCTRRGNCPIGHLRLQLRGADVGCPQSIAVPLHHSVRTEPSTFHKERKPRATHRHSGRVEIGQHWSGCMSWRGYQYRAPDASRVAGAHQYVAVCGDVHYFPQRIDRVARRTEALQELPQVLGLLCYAVPDDGRVSLSLRAVPSCLWVVEWYPPRACHPGLSVRSTPYCSDERRCSPLSLRSNRQARQDDNTCALAPDKGFVP